MDDEVDLLRELAVDLRDDGIDGIDRVVGDQVLVLENLRRECPHGRLDLFAGPIRLGFEFLLQQR